MIAIIDITIKNEYIYLESILEIENLSFPSPWSLQLFKEEINNPITSLWALMTDEALSGYICFWMFDSDIQLINIAIHPNRRGQGLGHYLITEMIESVSSKGINSIWLDVRPSNLAARKLYKKVGFEEISRKARYYKDTAEDAITMTLTLSHKGDYPLSSN
ncbi:MAG: ribosomal protein S18-alanine N-acetyltransferase [Thermodesulfobacteriota bacterium]|nr:ribosomal protein S18-alanine N-acetyltransferase [Thermodesulfobacteriota bacterium]